jgi:hypothetical protein
MPAASHSATAHPRQMDTCDFIEQVIGAHSVRFSQVCLERTVDF